MKATNMQSRTARNERWERQLCGELVSQAHLSFLAYAVDADDSLDHHSLRHHAYLG
jgi:hypothetical protein